MIKYLIKVFFTKKNLNNNSVSYLVQVDAAIHEKWVTCKQSYCCTRACSTTVLIGY